MLKTTIDISGFNRGMAGFVDKLGIAGPVVLKKEMGELVKTLVRVTPPKEPTKTRASIDKNVVGAFNALGESHRSFDATDAPTSASGIKWYAHDNKHLFGVAPDKDMTKAAPAELLSVYYRTYRRTSGRAYLELPFKRARKMQRVAISVKILTARKTVRALQAKIKSHVGRLKAGWLASWDKLKPTGANMPPNWVWRHKDRAQGYCDISGLQNKYRPEITIVNTAKGVGNPANKMDWIVTNALRIRAKAMAKNLTLFMKGKKNLSDYAKGHERN